MQHPQETTAEPKTQGIRGLRLVKQGGVIKCQLAQGIAEILIIIGGDGEDTRIDLGLGLLKTG